jgi:hypothetical protein
MSCAGLVYTHGRDEKYIQNLSENLKGRDHFGDLGIYVG